MADFQFLDIHSHLNDQRFSPDIDEALSRMRDERIATIVVGTDKEMSARAIALADGYSDIWATIGQHPTDKHNEEFDESWYREKAKHPRVVAIGECGIDYFRIEDDRATGKITNMDAEADRQKTLFEEQMELAASIDKPLMIHGRPERGSMDAYEDLLYILKNGQRKHGSKVRGNVHFFVGDTNIAKQFLDIGFTMSFTGVLTFAHEYDEVLRYIPLESIHAETDAPYVAPEPHRGKRNEPAFVVEVVRKIAEIKDLDSVDVKNALRENAARVFGIK